ncbi:MAG TPA: RNA-binding protein [Alphaproteobacteria bacterium]
MRRAKLKGNVFVGNLPEDFTDGRLAELFDPYGIVVGAYLARDVATGELQNYGLVDLAPKKAVQTAVQQLDGALVDGNRLEVRATEAAIALRQPRARSPIPVSRQASRRAFQVEYRSLARRI